MPPISKRAYLVVDGSSRLAFVPVAGGYLRTHWCVLVVPCANCGAKTGRPCRGRSAIDFDPTPRVNSGTHYVRRAAAQKIKTRPKVMEKLRKALPSVVIALEDLAVLDRTLS